MFSDPVASCFRRFVAVGDSQTEGLWDGDDHAGLTGFADRLAAAINTQQPGLRYANLALRGARITDVLNGQVPRAFALDPDLLSVCVGMNDVMRPGNGFDAALRELDVLYDRVGDREMTVFTTTFPSFAKVVPAGRLLAARQDRLNRVIRRAAERNGLVLVELEGADSMLAPQTWSSDRVHASPEGHALFAEAAAEALGLPGAGHDWAVGNRPDIPAAVASQIVAQVLWTQHFFVPWLWRRFRGRSSGDGRASKHVRLESVTPLPEQSPTNEAPTAGDDA
jgi:lysophospholipase L1-like esterase